MPAPTSDRGDEITEADVDMALLDEIWDEQPGKEEA